MGLLLAASASCGSTGDATAYPTEVKEHKYWIEQVLPQCHSVAAQISMCIDKSVHTTAQSMNLTGDQLRSLFSQPLATAGGLPLLVPTATMTDSEDDEGESTRD